MLSLINVGNMGKASLCSMVLGRSVPNDTRHNSDRELLVYGLNAAMSILQP